MLNRVFLAASALLVGLASSAFAQEVTVREDPVAVVELFTSQGCSSCPPADAMLSELGGRADVLALAYHVDYWDYIGWPDTFGSAEHSALQRSYVESWGRSRIYTPQMVINGRHGIVGSHADEVMDGLAEAYMPVAVSLVVDETGQTIAVSAGGYSGAREAVVWLVPYIAQASVAIERGENEGHSLQYSHIAAPRQAVGVWDPMGGTELRLPLAEALSGPYDGAVILIQEKHGELPGPIIGAAAFSR